MGHIVAIRAIGHEVQRSVSLTVILSLVGTLAAASIAGSVAVYVKRLDRRYAAEQRHSEDRGKAHEAYLAACDRAWHLRTKECVDNYLHPDQALPKGKIMEIGKVVSQHAESAIEDLQRHAGNFKKAAPILLCLYYSAFEQNPPSVAGFEAARVGVNELDRAESGLQEKLGIVRKASLLEQLKMRREVRRVMSNVSTIRGSTVQKRTR